MLEHENGFEQAGNPRGCLEVPDVWLNGANVKVVRPGNTFTEDLVDGRNLFSIAYLGSLSRVLSAEIHSIR
jgi:hypothetical protein